MTGPSAHHPSPPKFRRARVMDGSSLFVVVVVDLHPVCFQFGHSPRPPIPPLPTASSSQQGFEQSASSKDICCCCCWPAFLAQIFQHKCSFLFYFCSQQLERERERARVRGGLMKSRLAGCNLGPNRTLNWVVELAFVCWCAFEDFLG